MKSNIALVTVHLILSGFALISCESGPKTTVSVEMKRWEDNSVFIPQEELIKLFVAREQAEAEGREVKTASIHTPSLKTHLAYSQFRNAYRGVMAKHNAAIETIRASVGMAAPPDYLIDLRHLVKDVEHGTKKLSKLHAELPKEMSVDPITAISVGTALGKQIADLVNGFLRSRNQMREEERTNRRNLVMNELATRRMRDFDGL